VTTTNLLVKNTAPACIPKVDFENSRKVVGKTQTDSCSLSSSRLV